jgi:hypothetical protein
LYSTSALQSKISRPKERVVHNNLPTFDDDGDKHNRAHQKSSDTAHSYYDDDGGDYNYLPEPSTSSTSTSRTINVEGDTEMEDAHSNNYNNNDHKEDDSATEKVSSNVKVRVVPRADSSTVDELKQKAAEARKLEAKRQQEAKVAAGMPLLYY